MALTTFSPTENPSSPIDVQVQPRILIAQFGDGYEQRTGDGINTMRQIVNLRWDKIRVAVSDVIIAFFEARAGVEAFYYTLPGSGSQKKYKCSAWNRTRHEANLDSISARFTQVFDLGT
jgi:phage-related protein